MGLKKEIQEELEDEAFQQGIDSIVEKYNTDPDDDMRGFISSAMHRSMFGEYEPSPTEKRMMELEIENYKLKHGRK